MHLLEGINYTTYPILSAMHLAYCFLYECYQLSYPKQSVDWFALQSYKECKGKNRWDYPGFMKNKIDHI